MVKVSFRVEEGKTTGGFVSEKRIKGLIPISTLSEELFLRTIHTRCAVGIVRLGLGL